MSEGTPIHEVETSDLNPYRSPVAATPVRQLSRPTDDDGIPLGDADCRRILRAIRIGLAGTIVPSVVSILMILNVSLLWRAGADMGAAVVFRNGGLGIAALAGVVSLVGLVAGVTVLCSVHGHHRTPGWFGVVLFLAGATGTAGVLVRLINGGLLLGLAPLFAASVYSTLLTSVALMAMSYRHWANRIGSIRSARAFEASIVLLALSGASVSLAVLTPAVSRSGTVGPIVAWLAFVVAVVAMLILYGLNRLRRDWVVAMRGSVA